MRRQRLLCSHFTQADLELLVAGIVSSKLRSGNNKYQERASQSTP